MPTIIFFLMLNSVFANWDITWLKSNELQWSTSPPQSTDDIGVSIFCGASRFSQRTQIFLTLQNRKSVNICLQPTQLMAPSASDLKKVQESLPSMIGRIAKAVAHGRLSTRSQLHNSVSTSFRCRLLSSQNSYLPRFTSQTETADCSQESVRLGPDDTYEIAYDFVAPFVDLEEFVLILPSECDSQSRPPAKIVFHCHDKS